MQVQQHSTTMYSIPYTRVRPTSSHNQITMQEKFQGSACFLPVPVPLILLQSCAVIGRKIIRRLELFVTLSLYNCMTVQRKEIRCLRLQNFLMSAFRPLIRLKLQMDASQRKEQLRILKHCIQSIYIKARFTQKGIFSTLRLFA